MKCTETMKLIIIASILCGMSARATEGRELSLPYSHISLDPGKNQVLLSVNRVDSWTGANVQAIDIIALLVHLEHIGDDLNAVGNPIYDLKVKVLHYFDFSHLAHQPPIWGIFLVEVKAGGPIPLTIFESRVLSTGSLRRLDMESTITAQSQTGECGDLLSEKRDAAVLDE